LREHPEPAFSIGSAPQLGIAFKDGRPLSVDRLPIFARRTVHAVVPAVDALFMEQVTRLADISLKYLPTGYPQRELPTAGGLMSYGEDARSFPGASFVCAQRRSNSRGIHLVVSCGVLGLTVPPLLHIFANEVIQ
jgi:hypothetical protein